MNWEKDKLLWEGKGKKVFSLKGDSQRVWLEFKNTLTAFNGKKKGEFPQKGVYNRDISSVVFRFLKQKGFLSHWVEDVDVSAMICEKVDILPLEVVVRNRLAGSTAQKFQRKEGETLSEPLLEFFYKEDALGDPFLNDEQALWLKAARDKGELEQLKVMALKINQSLRCFFKDMSLDLVDFKMEFGRREGELLLADEISPDSCRLWDMKSQKKLDKDRFRLDLGEVEDSYKDIWLRMKGVFS